MRIKELPISEWEDALPDTGFSPFHPVDSLRVIDDHTTGNLHLYGGFQGEQPVGLIPVVVKEKPLAKAVFSPPPALGVQRMGPILMPTSPKMRKQEKVNRMFVDELLATLDDDHSFFLVRLDCDTVYTDPRPFRWAGFDIDFRFTYRLDLEPTTPDAVLKSFSKSLRREIRNGEELDHSITIQGTDGLRKIYDATQKRYEEQGIGFPMPWSFMRDIAYLWTTVLESTLPRHPTTNSLAGSLLSIRTIHATSGRGERPRLTGT